MLALLSRGGGAGRKGRTQVAEEEEDQGVGALPCHPREAPWSSLREEEEEGRLDHWLPQGDWVVVNDRGRLGRHQGRKRRGARSSIDWVPKSIAIASSATRAWSLQAAKANDLDASNVVDGPIKVGSGGGEGRERVEKIRGKLGDGLRGRLEEVVSRLRRATLEWGKEQRRQ